MAKPGLTLHRLRLFLAILDEGGIAKAAAKENISQPAVSEHLRGLEEYHGVRLVERMGRGVKPTEAARQLEPYARQVVHMLVCAEQVASDIQGVKGGCMSIGASSTPGTYLMPAFLAAFRNAYPGVELKVKIHNTTQVERWVANGDVDLGIVGDRSSLDTGFIAEPWLEDELVLLLNRRHPLAGEPAVTPNALEREGYVTREEGSSTRRAAEHIMQRMGVKVSHQTELGSTDAVREAVAAGVGVALVSKYAAAPHDVRVTSTRLGGLEWRRQFVVIYRARAPLSPAASRFKNLLFSSGSATWGSPSESGAWPSVPAVEHGRCDGAVTAHSVVAG